MSITLNGTTGITAPSVTGTPVIGGLVSGTAVTASGTSVDFTGIPSWAKRITVMFSGLSTNGTSLPIIQIGTSGGVQNTSYLSSASYLKLSSGVSVNGTTGFPLTGASNAAAIHNGSFVLSLLDSSTDTWSCFGVSGTSNDSQTGFCGGSKTLSDTLTQVRITTVNGTDTFDAGTINIMYEG